MNHMPLENDEQEDGELQRMVHRALKWCGWLLPETVDDVREAERALEENPVEIPEEFLDPARLIEAYPKDHANSATTTSPSPDWPSMSSGLAQLVQEVGLTSTQTITLMGFQSQMLFNRSSSKRDDFSYEDWKKFYLGVKDYL